MFSEVEFLVNANATVAFLVQVSDNSSANIESFFFKVLVLRLVTALESWVLNNFVVAMVFCCCGQAACVLPFFEQFYRYAGATSHLV